MDKGSGIFSAILYKKDNFDDFLFVFLNQKHSHPLSEKIFPKRKEFVPIYQIQYNPNGSNTDGSFTVDDSNSFFSPYKILPIAQENKCLGIFILILSCNCMLCVLIRIASSRRF